MNWKSYRKLIAVVVGLIAVLVPIFATADLSTKQGVLAAVLAVATAVGVYFAPNAGTKTP